MVVLFFGTPRFAVPTLQHLLGSSHTVAGVVTLTGGVIVTGVLPETPPMVAVMLAVPAVSPVTNPAGETDATAALDDDQAAVELRSASAAFA